MKHRPNHPVRGVSTTDRKRPFSFKAGSRAMSVVNSTAANAGTVESIEKTKNKAGEASPGTITLPASQAAPEIENAHQSRYKKANPLTMSERSALAQVKRAEFRAGPAQRANFKGESPDGYNHPTGTLSQANPRPALDANALKSILAERLKAGRAKQAALTNRPGRGMLSPLRVETAAADRFKGHQPRGVNMKLFLCPEICRFA